MTLLTPGRSYFFAGPDLTALINQQEVEVFDRLIVDGSAIEVKMLRQHLAQAMARPLGERRLLLITRADALTDVMQNTLLKLLEEPPTHLIVILQGERLDHFLPTVRSRLHYVKHVSEQSLPTKPTFAENSSEFEKQLRAVTDRSVLVEKLRAELAYQHQQLIQDYSPRGTRRIELLEKTINRLLQNCNQKLTIDALLLNWYNS